MTHWENPDVVTAGTFLFADRTAIELTNRLSRSPACEDIRLQLATWDRSVWSAALDQITEAAAGFLDIELGAVLVEGWRRHGALLEAAERTRTTSTSELVALWTHDLSLTRMPRIDVALGGRPIRAVELQIVVEISASGLSGVVNSGALVAVHGGPCRARVALSAEAVRLAERTGEFDPQSQVRLGDGVELAPLPDESAAHDDPAPMSGPVMVGPASPVYVDLRDGVEPTSRFPVGPWRPEL